MKGTRWTEPWWASQVLQYCTTTTWTFCLPNDVAAIFILQIFLAKHSSNVTSSLCMSVSCFCTSWLRKWRPKSASTWASVRAWSCRNKFLGIPPPNTNSAIPLVQFMRSSSTAFCAFVGFCGQEDFGAIILLLYSNEPVFYDVLKTEPFWLFCCLVVLNHQNVTS